MAFINTVKSFENPVKMLGRDPDSVIRNGKQSAFFGVSYIERDFSIVMVIFDCVITEIAYYFIYYAPDTVDFCMISRYKNRNFRASTDALNLSAASRQQSNKSSGVSSFNRLFSSSSERIIISATSSES